MPALNTLPTDGILDLADRVTAFRPGLAALQIRAQADWIRAAGITVVTVGEVKRGKSSLLNALTGRPGLLPVEADVATSTYLSISYGAREHALLVLEEELRSIPLADVVEYASLDPATGVERHPEVIGVEIRIDADALSDGLTLVDTPGVGGLLAGHSAITLSALEKADALLFVLNTDREVTKSELEFLEQAAKRTTRVLFAFNAIDRDVHWHALMERSAELVGRHTTQFAASPWFPVSGKFKTAADRAAATDPDLAADLLQRSRVEELLRALHDGLAHEVRGDRLLTLLDLCETALDAAGHEIEEHHRALRQDVGLPDDLNNERTRIAALREQSGPWRALITDGCGDLRRALAEDFDLRLVNLRNTALAAAAHGGRGQSVTVIRDLADGLRGLDMDLRRRLAAGTKAIVRRTSACFAASGVAVTEVELRFADGAPEVAVRDGAMRLSPASGPEGTDEDGAVRGGWLTGVLTAPDSDGVSGDSLIGGLMKLLGGAFAASWTMALDGIADLGRFAFGLRKGTDKRRADLEARIMGAVEHCRDTVPEVLGEAVRDFQEGLAHAAAAMLDDRLRRADDALAAAQRYRDADQSRLIPLIEDVQRRKDTLASLRTEAALFRTAIRA